MRTSDTAQRRSAKFTARLTSDTNCDNVRDLGRIDESDPLTGADERDREDV